jgi:hypothetical protein
MNGPEAGTAEMDAAMDAMASGAYNQPHGATPRTLQESGNRHCYLLVALLAAVFAYIFRHIGGL